MSIFSWFFKSKYDPFEPQTEIAKAVYKTLKTEAKKRGKGNRQKRESWVFLERDAVYKVTKKFRTNRGFWPTLTVLEMIEQQAYGHCDYAERYARGVEHFMLTGRY